ncbi:hypothetical protein GGS23DRAFT_598766 [Durotheca rogersii]|uniref:uncharacterized protein n=1 Tax=Durotheca rogersii TaxID=419775 RepID=UPI00221F7520|nr:uncharacterized protein GGS23DRAFT_598766 [Durotheca rogersii]KAI5861241.1 hypothetical protein GGS23DRAFT_598766 [Durotheca rogersii]
MHLLALAMGVLVASTVRLASGASVPAGTTTIADPSLGDDGLVCIPFEDPRCCVDQPVCQCDDGTFYDANPNPAGLQRLCAPPIGEGYGDVPESLPGWCCV